jgi:hypothetical protein
MAPCMGRDLMAGIMRGSERGDLVRVVDAIPVVSVPELWRDQATTI